MTTCAGRILFLASVTVTAVAWAPTSRASTVALKYPPAPAGLGHSRDGGASSDAGGVAPVYTCPVTEIGQDCPGGTCAPATCMNGLGDERPCGVCGPYVVDTGSIELCRGVAKDARDQSCGTGGTCEWQDGGYVTVVDSDGAQVGAVVGWNACVIPPPDPGGGSGECGYPQECEQSCDMQVAPLRHGDWMASAAGFGLALCVVLVRRSRRSC
jgi:hypothetical protein